MHLFKTDGNLFILFAPHIGLSDDGELGKYTRIGKTLLWFRNVLSLFPTFVLYVCSSTWLLC